MRAFLPRIILSLVVVIICVGIGYAVGYKCGHNRADKDLRGLTKMDLHESLNLATLLKDGDTNNMKRVIRGLIIIDTRHYDIPFGSETVTDQWFIKDLAAGRAMVQQNEKEWNEYVRTNRLPNTALEPTPTAP